MQGKQPAKKRKFKAVAPTRSPLQPLNRASPHHSSDEESDEDERFPSAEELVEQFDLAEQALLQQPLPPLPLPSMAGEADAAAAVSRQLDAVLQARLAPLQQQLDQLLLQQQKQQQALPVPVALQEQQEQQQAVPAPASQPAHLPSQLDDASLLDALLVVLAEDPSCLCPGSLPRTASHPAPAKERLLAAIAAALDIQ